MSEFGRTPGMTGSNETSRTERVGDNMRDTAQEYAREADTKAQEYSSQAREQFGQGNDQATGGGGMQDKAQAYAEDAKAKAQEYGEQAREQAEAGKEQAAGGMERAAEMVRERSEGTGGTAAQAGTKVADTMETAAGYMREHDVNEMWSDIETYAKTHPTQALLGAVVTGFLVGRLIR